MAHIIVHHFFIIFKAILQGIVLLGLWLTVVMVGLLLWTEFSSPVNLILGLPLMLLGLTMGTVVFFEMVLSIVSSNWRSTHCPFCSSTKSVKKILSTSKQD